MAPFLPPEIAVAGGPVWQNLQAELAELSNNHLHWLAQDGGHSLQHQELPPAQGRTPSYADRHVTGLYVYHNLAFIEKGPSAPAQEAPKPAEDAPPDRIAIASAAHKYSVGLPTPIAHHTRSAQI